jgi:hypothetical protein
VPFVDDGAHLHSIDIENARQLTFRQNAIRMKHRS